MMNNMKMKTGKLLSLLGMIIGISFNVIGVVYFFPNFGFVEIFWMIGALFVTSLSSFHFFLEDDDSTNASVMKDFTAAAEDSNSTQLQTISFLLKFKLISEEEFRCKRDDILKEKLKEKK